MPATIRPSLERRLNRERVGEVLFDAFSRGRYATDASHYQIMPAGVVVPDSMEAAERAIAIAREEGVPVTARGGGTSQCGQAINRGLIIDCSKHLNRLLHVDPERRTAVVEPGVVLDELNGQLKPHGLWLPVDVSTASRATVGGMTANNSCGGRSLRYGTMRDNVLAIEATLADGQRMRFGEVDPAMLTANDPGAEASLIRDLIAIGRREAPEVAARFPEVQRRVGGYNLDALDPALGRVNLAHLLVGSEGTLAFSRAIEVKLWPVLGPKVFGVCHFGSFQAAMESAQHLVKLKPIAVELVDRTMLELAREIAIFGPTVKAVVRGEPDALLVVEFAEDTAANNARKLSELEQMMGDLGFGWDQTPQRWGGVVPVTEPKLQAAVTDMRQSGLNIMMSMKTEGKPISFVEDCAVPLEHLAAYTDRLTRIFERHGTRGTWYAHASVGCLHVRPVLNLKLEKDVKAMRAIAEEAFAAVREYKGSHSGEHGDGIVRSEFHEAMFGSRLVRAFEAVKDRLDPEGLFNPNRIVRAPRMDDRSLMRYPPGYRVEDRPTALDWSAWPGAAGGLQGAVEMCNNNGACRKLEGGAMCPSYRATRNERDVTRGRANTLRLALSSQLGPDAFSSDEMAETLKLCVSCKACRRECPTGVDMARLKIEVLAARRARFGLTLHQRLVGWLPRYAPLAARLPWLLNARDRIPALARLSERVAQFSARRTLPRWRRDIFETRGSALDIPDGPEVVLLADTFNRYFERERLDAAVDVLTAGGWRVHTAQPTDGSARPLCCGRTFLAVGAVEEAKVEARRMLDGLMPYVRRGVPVVGLEPSCLLTLRDELPALLPGPDATRLSDAALLIEEFIMRESKSGRLALPLAPVPRKALLHGHCHQKAFGAMGAVESALRLVPGLELATIESSCCGMAGAFGYHADTVDTSLAMAELSLLPALRRASQDALIVADGTSCRHQIADATGREALHAVEVLAMSLAQSRGDAHRPHPRTAALAP
jgi:FAD/FMN-containing dehydrogenase/Fe-S oxidoreductase